MDSFRSEDEDRVAPFMDPTYFKKPLSSHPLILYLSTPLSKTLSLISPAFLPCVASEQKLDGFASCLRPPHLFWSSSKSIIVMPDLQRFLISPGGRGEGGGLESLQSAIYAKPFEDRPLPHTWGAHLPVRRIVWNLIVRTSFTCIWLVTAMSISLARTDLISTVSSEITFSSTFTTWSHTCVQGDALVLSWDGLDYKYLNN